LSAITRDGRTTLSPMSDRVSKLKATAYRDGADREVGAFAGKQPDFIGIRESGERRIPTISSSPGVVATSV
jgi:hypothetical protein